VEGIRQVQMLRCVPAAREKRPLLDDVVAEGPLRIVVNRTDTFTLMRTPGRDRELTVGFLLTEGFIGKLGDIHLLMTCPDTPDVIDVTTAAPIAPSAARSMVVNSSCGLCGRLDIDEMLRSLEPVRDAVSMAAGIPLAVQHRLREEQPLFLATGGTHASALFDNSGKLLVVHEDIGRHNALDKVLGHALMAKIGTTGCGVFLSGRVSLEMIVKAVRAGIGVVAAVGAPTTAAVAAAERLNVTLCGFARGEQMNIYTHEHRLTLGG